MFVNVIGGHGFITRVSFHTFRNHGLIRNQEQCSNRNTVGKGRNEKGGRFHINGHGTHFSQVIFEFVVVFPNTAVGGVNYAGNTEVINPGFLEGSVDETGKSEVDLTLVNLKLTYELDDYSLISVTSYYDGEYQQKQDLDGTSQPFFGMDWGSDTDAVSQDLRLVSEYDGPFNFIVGAYYGNEKINTDILHKDFFGTGQKEFFSLF